MMWKDRRKPHLTTPTARTRRRLQRRRAGSAYIALGLGILFMVVGLLLAISAFPTETKRGILVIGSLFPGDVAAGQGEAQDTLFFLGFAILALGPGLILAEGFAQRYTITYLGVSLSGTLGIVGLAFIGWKTIAQPPVFRYATVRFVCPDNTPPDGDIRLRVHTRIRCCRTSGRIWWPGCSSSSTIVTTSKATEIAELEATKVRRSGSAGRFRLLPAAGRRERQPALPTLLDIRHEVTFEYKPPVRPGAEVASPAGDGRRSTAGRRISALHAARRDAAGDSRQPRLVARLAAAAS